MANEVFADNSKYFRNALVRANYSNIQYGIKETTEYLERFFRNLLIGEKDELKSRYMIIATPWNEGKSTQENSVSTKKSVQPLWLHAIAISIRTWDYFTSSKSTVTHYQCVSTGCCVHVARIKISLDNQHVTKPMQMYDILPEQPKEKA